MRGISYLGSYRPFITQKKNCSVFGVHGTQNDWLVSMQKSVLKNMHRDRRYWPKCLKIWRFGLATWILAHFAQYLWTRCILFKTDFCIETVSSSRSFWVPWTLSSEEFFLTYWGVLKFSYAMRAVGKTPNGFNFIRISSYTPKNIQEGSAEIICEDINILSNPNVLCSNIELGDCI